MESHSACDKPLSKDLQTFNSCTLNSAQCISWAQREDGCKCTAVWCRMERNRRVRAAQWDCCAGEKALFSLWRNVSPYLQIFLTFWRSIPVRLDGLLDFCGHLLSALCCLAHLESRFLEISASAPASRIDILFLYTFFFLWLDIQWVYLPSWRMAVYNIRFIWKRKNCLTFKCSDNVEILVAISSFCNWNLYCDIFLLFGIKFVVIGNSFWCIRVHFEHERKRIWGK